MDDIAVRVENLSKAYRIFNSPGKRFLYHVFHTKGGRDFWALKDVSFEIKRGETFGIIGVNGSGKSTLLQVLAGIIEPTSGTLQVNGKVSALLELGSGFNPENTGYENIYMNAAILGVNKKKIEAKINEIIEFAAIGEFINQPVKTYSSGMYIRLAFAVAINVDADIILIDEALAVGDVFFRQKCYKKLNQLKDDGKTIVLVSHGMNEVEQFCDRSILLHKGNTVILGESRDVVKQYYLMEQNISVKKKSDIDDYSETKKDKDMVYIHQNNFGNWRIVDNSFIDLDLSVEIKCEKTKFLKIGLFDESGRTRRSFYQGEWAYFYYEVQVMQRIGVPLLGTILYDQKNNISHGKDNLQLFSELPAHVEGGTKVCVLQRMKLDVAIGEYTFDVGFATMDFKDYKERAQYNQEEVNSMMQRLCMRSKVGVFSVQALTKGNPMRIMFHGCCDLPGEIIVSTTKTGE